MLGGDRYVSSHSCRLSGEEARTAWRTIGKEATTDPDNLCREVALGEQEAMYREHVAGRLRGVRPGALRSSACMYTVTPDAGFVVDWLPSDARVLVASACSGHGFKHSAGLGEAVAMAVTGSGAGLAAFGANRLAAFA